MLLMSALSTVFANRVFACVCVFVHVEQPGPKRLSMLITLKNVSSNFGNFRLFRVVGTLVFLLYGMFLSSVSMFMCVYVFRSEPFFASLQLMLSAFA